MSKEIGLGETRAEPTFPESDIDTPLLVEAKKPTPANFRYKMETCWEVGIDHDNEFKAPQVRIRSSGGKTRCEIGFRDFELTSTLASMIAWAMLKHLESRNMIHEPGFGDAEVSTLDQLEANFTPPW